MTTLAEHAEMLRKWADVLEIPSGSFVNDDLRAAADALSSSPKQAVAYRVRHKGDERWALTFTDPRVTPSGAINDEIEAEPLGLITEGLVTPPSSRGVEAALVKGDGASASSPDLAPSHPAAVGVTDEMVERVSVPYDGFTGDVIGNYTTREGKQGVVVQQDGTRVVHVYGRSRVVAALRSTP